MSGRLMVSVLAFTFSSIAGGLLRIQLTNISNRLASASFDSATNAYWWPNIAGCLLHGAFARLPEAPPALRLAATVALTGSLTTFSSVMLVLHERLWDIALSDALAIALDFVTMSCAAYFAGLWLASYVDAEPGAQLQNTGFLHRPTSAPAMGAAMPSSQPAADAAAAPAPAVQEAFVPWWAPRHTTALLASAIVA
jgi:fluoride ion exporter CrcB/FEX